MSLEFNGKSLNLDDKSSSWDDNFGILLTQTEIFGFKVVVEECLIFTSWVYHSGRVYEKNENGVFYQ